MGRIFFFFSIEILFSSTLRRDEPYDSLHRGVASGASRGSISSINLTLAYLERIAAYDRAGPLLNAVPILNPLAEEDARASDMRRAIGQTLSPLDGIPYTAKMSFKAKNLPVSAGSPALANLIAQDDAFAISKLRSAGAILLGLTNMPPMANGGMQRGLHGRAESPYNANYLTSAFASGSSNGSGTATASSFGAFGLGEETWSSGRAPAALNGLCAYTPSRGIISVVGNWPLVPTMDVVVPHTRSMADMLEVLDILIVDDTETRGDFWRSQPWITLPSPSTLRVPAGLNSISLGASLYGKKLGVPRMYINADTLAGTSNQPGIGGPTGQRIITRASIMALWEQARDAMEKAGAEVVTTDFPIVSNYEGDRPGASSIRSHELLPSGFLKREITDLSVWAWDDFLQANNDPNLNRLADVDGTSIFPPIPGTLPDRYIGFDDDINDYPAYARAHPCTDFRNIPEIEDGLRGLEAIRKRDLEDWMDSHDLDAIVFPALADVAPADADINPESASIAWSNGVWVANGNLAIRHFGIPTVTVPMGQMSDTCMPMGLTFLGRAYDDMTLLMIGTAFEVLGNWRIPPPRTPDL